MSAQARPVASLPQASGGQQARDVHKAPFYVPSSKQLEPGGRNPLILALRSGIPDEVDWALPRLVVASYDHPDRFQLDRFIDALPALLEWPNAWLQDLERCAALDEARRNGTAGLALAAVPEWMIDPATEVRAINSLLVLRNASFARSNTIHIASKSVVKFITHLFSLPHDFLLDLLLRSPEPVQHTLVILQSILPVLDPTKPILHLLSSTLPTLLIETRDMAILHLLLPLVISALTIPSLPPLPPTLAPYLVLLLSLTPPPSILDLTLDLLISLTLTPGPARILLSSPNVSAHLRHLVRLLEHGARHTTAGFDPLSWTQGGMARNPASPAWAADEASRKRSNEREQAQRRIQAYGPGSVITDVGDRPPNLADSIKAKLYKMKEPQRSIQWMHESFVYSATSQLPQVSFWHSYRDFFTNSQVSEPLLSASEVIKNVTEAFPGASAKVWVDEGGVQRFVIGGMGFRRSTEDFDKYICRWSHCTTPHGSSNPAQLLSHLHANHLMNASGPIPCGWASCTAKMPCTTSHLLTHIPLPRLQPVPDMVLSNPKAEGWLSAPGITGRAPPRLPPTYKLHFTAFSTPTDPRTRHPMGAAFLSALLIRNLAKTLRAELASADPADDLVFTTGNARTPASRSRRQEQLRAERFGLPIPETILREEEEEERNAAKVDDVEGSLNWEERERARAAFESVEEKLGETVAGNLSGLGQYLGEAWGW